MTAIRFREKYRLTMLALWRRGQFVEGRLNEEPLQLGDMLPVQGRRDFVNILRDQPRLPGIGTCATGNPPDRQGSGGAGHFCRAFGCGYLGVIAVALPIFWPLFR
jgi:hypothetical protein